ncbi:unnamed protein product [Ectocarpus sp. CCAP 1310/34]|nr:unnamed protein product [Ectocarpus sp. CCAP 1310/34]
MLALCLCRVRIFSPFASIITVLQNQYVTLCVKSCHSHLQNGLFSAPLLSLLLFAFYFCRSQHTGHKAVAIKTGGKEKLRITAVLAANMKGGKLPPLLIFKGKPTAPGKPPAANSVEREFRVGKDKKGVAYPQRVVYAVDDKAWHTQRVFRDVWLPQLWNRRPGREGVLGKYRQPDTLLSWDDYIVHKTALCKEAMDKSNTTLLFVPGGPTPKIQPRDGIVNKLFKSNMSRLHDDHMASTDAVRNDRGHPEPPSRGLLAQWVKKKAWDKMDPESIRSSWRKAGMTLAFDGSEDEAWANKKLNSDAQGKPLRAGGDAAAAGVEEVGPSEEGRRWQTRWICWKSTTMTTREMAKASMTQRLRSW